MCAHSAQPANQTLDDYENAIIAQDAEDLPDGTEIDLPVLFRASVDLNEHI